MRNPSGRGESEGRLDSAGPYAKPRILTVSIVDGARELRLPAQAHAGAGASGPNAIFLFGILLVGRPVRAQPAAPAASPSRWLYGSRGTGSAGRLPPPPPPPPARPERALSARRAAS